MLKFIHMRKRLQIHNLITSLQALRLTSGEPCNCWLHSRLLEIMGMSIPNSREAGRCETRRRRVGALVTQYWRNTSLCKFYLDVVCYSLCCNSHLFYNNKLHVEPIVLLTQSSS
ncbi:hypothetical protein Y032_0388g499 [Ancylostoma ceylanicum]|uniref:Uncharacterized protein n=1 Tax=Ancylostoma ceylanicum TaxID=53326 RepID=A0A016RT15_9BILA|nr:hypothetical protein Y032_0388g499 [Ancylostoma ceylanicum]